MWSLLLGGSKLRQLVGSFAVCNGVNAAILKLLCVYRRINQIRIRILTAGEERNKNKMKKTRKDALVLKWTKRSV